MNRNRSVRIAGLALATAAITGLGMSAADARAGSGRSMGSRGGFTYQAPPSTATAPRPAAPLERSMTPQQAPSPSLAQSAARPQAAPVAPASRFGPGFMGGLLGAGLLGALFGAGFFGGLGGLASVIGFVLQVALIGGLIMLALRFFRSRQQPAYVGAGAPMTGNLAGSLGQLRRSAETGLARTGLAGTGLAGTTPSGPAPQPVTVASDDFETFERLLNEVQIAFGREDLDTLRRLVTPEMASYFAQDIAENARRGEQNSLSEPKLLQGDLAEAWHEGDTRYATVSMRFSLIDVKTDRATGEVIDGDPVNAVEATEVWTFQQRVDGPWLLAAIQQTG